MAALADVELTNESRRVWPDLKDILLLLGGQRVQSEQSSAIAKIVEVLESLLNDSQELFIATSELLPKIQWVDELAWIKSTKSLGSFLSKFGLFARRDSTGQRRGYLIRSEWLNDLKIRYIAFPGDNKASEPSEGFMGSEVT